MHTRSPIQKDESLIPLKELCEILSISAATGKNWLKSGKLLPTSYDGKSPLFTAAYVDELKQNLLNGSLPLLKSRRNKKYLCGHQFYHSYIATDSPNLPNIQRLLELLTKAGWTPAETDIRILLAECALHLYISAHSIAMDNCPPSFLALYLDGHSSFGKHRLIDKLLPTPEESKTFIRKHADLLSIPYRYIAGEDLLGLLYLSLRSLGNRKASGAYYTPFDTVQKLLQELPKPTPSDTLLDPCCGTGNFLLQLSDSFAFSQIYGMDIDWLSVAITRLNLSLKYPDADLQTLEKHIVQGDFLHLKPNQYYHYIIGNPPWGFSYSKEEKIQLKKEYACAGNTPESYDLFLEKGIQTLHPNGILSFVLPEALLMVKNHTSIRRLILQSCQVDSLTSLGNVFDGVQCPSIILQLVKTNQKKQKNGIRILGKQCFTIEKERALNEDGFPLLVSDQDYALLQKIESIVPSCRLKGQADFALGIVTGDNRQFLSITRQDGLEPVLKGQDIAPFQVHKAEHYLAFQPDNFQQVAPEPLYRAPEKLLYRFISRYLVFALDTSQKLSLNSCNLLIPHLDGIQNKYLLTVLNSRVMQFLFQKKWNSLKVLRSHLEQLPIPLLSANQQKYFVSMAEALAYTNSPAKRLQLYNEVDQRIADLFSLTQEEYKQIVRCCSKYECSFFRNE